MGKKYVGPSLEYPMGHYVDDGEGGDSGLNPLTAITSGLGDIGKNLSNIGTEAGNFVDRNIINPIDSAINGSRDEGPGGLQGIINQGNQNAADRANVKSITDMQASLVDQAKKFESDIPKNKQMLLGASDAQSYGQTRQQERMAKSRAAAGGQVGSGIAKLRLANLSAGAKYAHILASNEIENKLKTQSQAISQDAINKGQALAGMSLDKAQQQYDLDMANLKNQNAITGSALGAIGYGAGAYIGAQNDPNQRVVPTYNMNYSQDLQMPELGATQQRYGLLGNYSYGPQATKKEYGLGAL